MVSIMQQKYSYAFCRLPGLEGGVDGNVATDGPISHFNRFAVLPTF